MLLLILFIIYIVSFFAVRYIHRLHSSKHYNLWNDEDCEINITWYLPIMNTLTAIIYSIILYTSVQKPINKPKWKIFNWDL